MGAAVGTDEKGSVNVELNIVPFIDLMSCLTAFLLVTAVWVNIAQINIQPKGKTRDTSNVQKDDETVTLSVLVQADRIWVGLSRVNEFQEIPKKARRAGLGEVRDHAQGAQGLGVLRGPGRPRDRRARARPQQPVKYQDVIHAMDVAVKVGFIDVGLSDPAGLAARPQPVRRRPCRFIQQAHASITRSRSSTWSRRSGSAHGGADRRTSR